MKEKCTAEIKDFFCTEDNHYFFQGISKNGKTVNMPKQVC